MADYAVTVTVTYTIRADSMQEALDSIRPTMQKAFTVANSVDGFDIPDVRIQRFIRTDVTRKRGKKTS